jgi:signal transduction histidine kinase
VSGGSGDSGGTGDSEGSGDSGGSGGSGDSGGSGSSGAEADPSPGGTGDAGLARSLPSAGFGELAAGAAKSEGSPGLAGEHAEGRQEQERKFEKKFRLVKYFSSVAIAVIFASCLSLAVIMSTKAEDIIYARIVDDTVMIMDNLNYQMFNNFLIPSYTVRGNARLSDPEPYTLLNSVIEDTVYGFDISRVDLYEPRFGMRIYTSDSAEPVVVYRPSPETGELEPHGEFAEPMGAYLEAINRAVMPDPDTGPARAPGVYGGLMSVWRETGRAGREEYRARLLSRTAIRRQEGSFLVGGFFPRGEFSIRCFKAMEDYASAGVSGVLAITRDVTAEYRQIAAMQYAALAIAVGATIFITFALRMVVARGEDIINQRNAEKAALNERLNQAERLVNLGRMVATVSHEIRNPLGIINSSADYLSRSLKDNPKLARLSGAIVDESTRLSRIVTDFLDFARPQKPRMSEAVVEDILEEIFVLLEVDMSRAGVELRAGLREDPGVIMADATLLHRAFMNILVNAIQAMPEGGLLTVTTALDPGGAGLPPCVAVKVTDTGPGITAAALESLFKPFFTTKTKGTGLGLVLVRNIVEGHGGRLVLRNVEEGEIANVEGHGLEVTISLPLAPDGQGEG